MQTVLILMICLCTPAPASCIDTPALEQLFLEQNKEKKQN